MTREKPIWAPWRMEYILDDKEGECIFCTAREPEDDDKKYIFLRYPTCFAVLNRYPYNNGHALVAPYRHTDDINDLIDEEMLDIMKTIRHSMNLLTKVISPDGFNVGLNAGQAAGAGIVAHLHYHIVPRWIGDTNFMPAVAGVKIIPQALDELYQKLREAEGTVR